MLLFAISLYTGQIKTNRLQPAMFLCIFINPSTAKFKFSPTFVSPLPPATLNARKIPFLV